MPGSSITVAFTWLNSRGILLNVGVKKVFETTPKGSF